MMLSRSDDRDYEGIIEAHLYGNAQAIWSPYQFDDIRSAPPQ